MKFTELSWRDRGPSPPKRRNRKRKEGGRERGREVLFHVLEVASSQLESFGWAG